VTSRTEARDLEWRFDAILRLAESQLDAAKRFCSECGTPVQAAVN